VPTGGIVRVHGCIASVTREGAKEVRFDSEPEASLSKRIKVRVLSWLPIQGLR
jgi:hypothetical protein